jgi:sortase B
MGENMGKKRKFQTKGPMNLYKAGTVILAVALVAILIMWGRERLIQREAEQDFEEMAAQVNSVQYPTLDNSITTSGTEEGTETESETEEVMGQAQYEIPEKNLNWTELDETNSDIYAWICVPGTKIDYPILQHPSDDSYYLYYNMKGTRGYPGCIYTELQNSRDFTDFDTVVYGHNMRNDSMFSTLHYYADKTFFLNCPYIYIYTDNRILVYDIFAAYTGDDAHILNTNDFSTEQGRQQYIESILAYGKASDLIRDDVAQEVTAASRILTLSTCVSGKSEERFIVQALLISEETL